LLVPADAVGRQRPAAVGADVGDGAAPFGGFGLQGVAGVVPGLQAALERVGAVALLAENLRHTGARVFLRSGAVGDDRLPARAPCAVVERLRSPRATAETNTRAASNRLTWPGRMRCRGPSTRRSMWAVAGSAPDGHGPCLAALARSSMVDVVHPSLATDSIP